jgi:hypothetical protein
MKAPAPLPKSQVAAATTSSPTMTTVKPARTAEPCKHNPECPQLGAADEQAAVLVVFHALQGWGQLCNGLVVWADGGHL